MTDLTLLINSVARKHQITPQLVAAIIYEESRGKVYRTRFEMRWFTRLRGIKRDQLLGFVPGESLCSLDTEKVHRATSWGLCQILGETARERGFQGENLTQLIEPEVGVDIAMGYLAHLIKLKGNEYDAVLAYNGGADDQYPIRVYAHIDEGRIENL